MTQEKRITSATGRNQRAPHPSACLLAGSVCFYREWPIWIPAPAARTSALPLPRAGSGPRAAAPPRPRASPGPAACVGMALQEKPLPRGCKWHVQQPREGAKHTPPRCSGSSSAPSRRLPPLLPCGAQPCMVGRERHGKPGREQSKGEGTNSFWN